MDSKSDAPKMVLLDGQTPGSGVEAGDTQTYLKELEKERDFLEQSNNCPKALAYITREIEKITNKTRDPPPVVDITKDVPIAVSCRVPLPVKEFPKFNFVGKLLGPKGNSLKRLQESTMSRMIVCGRGSMKDKMKEEELRTSEDPKNAHLKCDPYVDIVVRAPPAEAYARLAHALTEIRPFLTPCKNDAISQSQMREMEGLMNGTVMPGGGMGDKAAPWGMGPYPPHPRPPGPMGMKNGPPPAPYGGGGAPNFNGPPGPGGFRPQYPPAAGGGFGGAQYGGGPGYAGGPGYGGPSGGGYGAGPGGAYGPSAGAAPNPGGYGPAAAAAGSLGGFGGNQGGGGGMGGQGGGGGSGPAAGGGGRPGGAANGGYYGAGGGAGGAGGGAARSTFGYSDYM